MPFTPPVIFANFTPIEASDLTLCFDSLRKYINKQIAATDLDTATFGTAEIVKGEYYNVVPDHQFTTGDVYTQNIIAEPDIAGGRCYYSSTTKNTLATQWSFNDQYQVVSDTGKSIYFEQNNAIEIDTNLAAKIIITGHISPRNEFQYTYSTDFNSTSPQETRFYLLYKIEGVSDQWQVATATKGQVLGFEDYQNVSGVTGQPGGGTDTYNDRRVIPFLFEYDIPNAWESGILNGDENPPQTLAWRFAIGVETTIDMGWVSNRYVRYEVFYA